MELVESRRFLPIPTYEYIRTVDEATEALEYFSSLSEFEVDTEGTGLDPYTSKVVLLQFGAEGRVCIFDVRKDISKSEVDLLFFKDILTNKKIKKLLQNASYDMEMIKANAGYYIQNIYDTMLVEQLLNLGLFTKANLQLLVKKYLGLEMDKEPRGTFEDYYQEFQQYQLDYAAVDVTILTMIRDMQASEIEKHGLADVVQLEFDFVKALCEMELNGITMDVERWRELMADVEKEQFEHEKTLHSILSTKADQTTLFGVSKVNINSNKQLLVELNKFGFNLESTGVEVLEDYAGHPAIDALLDYRKTQKLLSTYGETLLAQINPVTGRLHTSFKQMVSTGRMSSNNPNLQNIPGKQKFRSRFIAKDGYVLITADMSGAELRILGNLSKEPAFKYCYDHGVDIHTKTASEVYKVSMEEAANNKYRKPAKAIGFGIVYGMSKYGLSRRLKISEKEADKVINGYFQAYPLIYEYLTKSGRDAVRLGYSRSISGRKRFYNVPYPSSPDYKKISRGIERQAKNAPIQGSNADTIKKAMVYVVEALEQLDYDAELILTVHDELIIQTIYEKRYEVAKIVEESIIKGFGYYFDHIVMETTALISPCWMKEKCDYDVEGGKCGGIEFEFRGKDLTCIKCNGIIK
jgi:DNA polymerase-1